MFSGRSGLHPVERSPVLIAGGWDNGWLWVTHSTYADPNPMPAPTHVGHPSPVFALRLFRPDRSLPAPDGPSQRAPRYGVPVLTPVITAKFPTRLDTNTIPILDRLGLTTAYRRRSSRRTVVDTCRKRRKMYPYRNNEEARQ